MTVNKSTPPAQTSAPARINHADLRVIEAASLSFPLKIDLVYADEAHPENIFQSAIYRQDAPFILHKDLAAITLKAAEDCFKTHGLIFVLKDGLRPVEAQQAMQETDIVKENPHWCQEPNRLLSPPGHGGHPRGMAVDIILIDQEGAAIDMGTPFDYLSSDPSDNPAARDYPNLSQAVINNRALLENAMMKAAGALSLPLLPLPSEWWDFRFPKDVYNRFAPIRDAELEPHMQML